MATSLVIGRNLEDQIAVLHNASLGNISPVCVDHIAADGAAHDIRPVRSIGIQLAIPPDGCSQLANVIFAAVIAVPDTGQVNRRRSCSGDAPPGVVPPGVLPPGDPPLSGDGNQIGFVGYVAASIFDDDIDLIAEASLPELLQTRGFPDLLANQERRIHKCGCRSGRRCPPRFLPSWS